MWQGIADSEQALGLAALRLWRPDARQTNGCGRREGDIKLVEQAVGARTRGPLDRVQGEQAQQPSRNNTYPRSGQVLQHGSKRLEEPRTDGRLQIPDSGPETVIFAGLQPK